MRATSSRLISALALAACLSACAVGPRYAGPPRVAEDAVARGRFVRAGDAALVPTPGIARWWETLGDPVLTTLVDDALAHNPRIDQATARIREAQATLDRQNAARLPSATPNAAYLHAHLPPLSGNGDGTSLSFYNLGLNATWELDLFGALSRGVDQARRTAEARVADLADAQVSLSAQVAQTYVALRDVQARIALNDRSAALQRQQLGLTRDRYGRGVASALDIERLDGALRNTEAQAVPLGAQRDEYLNLLATLTGRAPGALDATLAAPAPVPLPPATVAVGDPATLIANRPDVRAAERQLAAATDAVAVSKARELPAIRFLGLLGLGGTSPGDVFDPGKLTTLAAPMLSWSLLDFGKARAATRATSAQRDQAEAAYRLAVLGALQDAETALSRFTSLRQQLASLSQAEAAAARAARLNALRVQAGTSATIDQLDIDRQLLAAQIAVTQARAQLTNSYIGVEKSLGLGWTPPPAPTR